MDLSKDLGDMSSTFMGVLLRSIDFWSAEGWLLLALEPFSVEATFLTYTIFVDEKHEE